MMSEMSCLFLKISNGVKCGILEMTRVAVLDLSQKRMSRLDSLEWKTGVLFLLLMPYLGPLLSIYIKRVPRC